MKWGVLALCLEGNWARSIGQVAKAIWDRYFDEKSVCLYEQKNEMIIWKRWFELRRSLKQYKIAGNVNILSGNETRGCFAKGWERDRLILMRLKNIVLQVNVFMDWIIMSFNTTYDPRDYIAVFVFSVFLCFCLFFLFLSGVVICSF